MQQSNHNASIDKLLTEVYEKVSLGEDRQAGIHLFKFTETLLRDESIKDTPNLLLLDDLLRTVDVCRLDCLCMLALVRGNYRVRTLLQHWEGLLQRVKDEMIRRGLNYESLLRGLLRN